MPQYIHACDRLFIPASHTYKQEWIALQGAVDVGDIALPSFLSIHINPEVWGILHIRHGNVGPSVLFYGFYQAHLSPACHKPT